jgi:hypothetical protein
MTTQLPQTIQIKRFLQNREIRRVAEELEGEVGVMRED